MLSFGKVIKILITYACCWWTGQMNMSSLWCWWVMDDIYLTSLMPGSLLGNCRKLQGSLSFKCGQILMSNGCDMLDFRDAKSLLGKCTEEWFCLALVWGLRLRGAQVSSLVEFWWVMAEIWLILLMPEFARSLLDRWPESLIFCLGLVAIA